MASLHSKFQILGIKTSKENGYQLLKNSSMLKENIRTFWKLQSKKKPEEYGDGNCGEPLPPCMDLVSKNCPSKCLEFQKKSTWRKWFSLKREPKKEKPSNCKISKPPEEPAFTWWEWIFGPDPKRSWPDPCTCRLAHRERKKRRQYDPRLSDKRYQQTAGDVLLYTELMQCRTHSCLEPQPKSPPGYKVPKAAMVRMISIFADQAPRGLFVPDEQSPESKKSTTMSFRIPYSELRPEETEKKQFVCRRGISTEDVQPPINKNFSVYGYAEPSTLEKSNLLKNLRLPEKISKKSLENNVDVEVKVAKRSRIEQLKVLIAGKEMPECTKSPISK